MKTNVLLIGNSARGHAIAEAVTKSIPDGLFAYMKANNQGIAGLADAVETGNYDDLKHITSYAKKRDINLAIIDPEKPLYHGAVDALKAYGIPTVGPIQSLARIETSKAFADKLMAEHGIPGCPKSRTFTSLNDIRDYIAENVPVVLKPDGLTGGKGVQVQDEHFQSIDEALKICRKILEEHEAVVIQEKLEGEEFSLQCFTDGETVIPMPPVQDHKRRLAGDQGLNTGSMGSYSCADHLLPFLTQAELDQASKILRQIVAALYRETGFFYKGIIYGGFMLTRDGVKLLECNARFGDPEAINVLSLLETNFLDICRAITTGTLDEMAIRFFPLATVVKYVVPINYGLPQGQIVPVTSDLIQISDLGKASLYYSSVNSDAAGRHLTSSRAVAVLGMSYDLAKAEKIAEQGTLAITGAVDHRSDIGTAALIAKRVRHLEELRQAEREWRLDGMA